MTTCYSKNAENSKAGCSNTSLRPWKNPVACGGLFGCDVN
jgi:hypothetical protein